jgi:hypothetical protein
MHTVLKTPISEAQRRVLSLSDDAFIRIATAIGMSPRAGRPVLGIAGLTTVTLSPVVSGAEADIEVLAFYAGDDIPIFLLDLAYVGEPLTFSNRDRAELEGNLAELAAEYRTGEASKVVRLRKRDGQD